MRVARKSRRKGPSPDMEESFTDPLAVQVQQDASAASIAVEVKKSIQVGM